MFSRHIPCLLTVSSYFPPLQHWGLDSCRAQSQMKTRCLHALSAGFFHFCGGVGIKFLIVSDSDIPLFLLFSLLEMDANVFLYINKAETKYLYTVSTFLNSCYRSVRISKITTVC